MSVVLAVGCDLVEVGGDGVHKERAIDLFYRREIDICDALRRQIAQSVSGDGGNYDSVQAR